MKIKQLFLDMAIVILGLAAMAQPAGAASLPEVMFILDGSGSMWGTAGGKMKIEAAKEVMAQVVPGLPPEVKVGLTVYGHRRKGDCADIEQLMPPGSDDRDRLLALVRSITPKGKTPMAASIGQVAEQLKTRENETTIVLVSDGIETCHDDPCGAVKKLKEAGIKFVLHVVGFGVNQKAAQQLTCMAQAGGGRYFAAADASGLTQALEAVKADVAVKVEKAKTTTVKAASRLGKLRITMPADAVRTLGEIWILKGDKVVKKAQPAADSTHPLLAGDYSLVLAFANTNYQKPSEAPIGNVTVSGGQTAEVKLGALVINLAPGLGEATETVSVIDQENGETLVSTPAGGNDYYLFKPKPLPAGTYSLAFTYSRSKEPAVVAAGIKVPAGGQAVVTLDSGIALKKAGGITGWDVLPTGGDKPVLQVRRRWDNDYPLWKKFPLQPGSYDIRVYMKGMDEPLPVGQGIEIKKGETLVFDTGV